ncbi:hypothetical protein P3G55_00540 [Leptospira sp. 96542]|nr:hypothetical protein [Leptospira sp. 96542]
MPDADIFYHFAIAKLYATEGFVRTLPWPELGIQSTEFTDFHFLIHLTQIPFALLPINGNTSIKLYIFSCLVFLLYQLFRYFESIQFRNSYYLLALFFILGSTLFTGRLLFGRGNIILFGLLFLSLRIWNQNKNKYLFALGFIAVWFYSGFLLLITVFGLLCLVNRSKIVFQRFLYLSFGIFLGITIHPSFPNQWGGYFLELIIQSFPPKAVEPIAEWLPPTKELILLGFLPSLPLLILSFVQSKKLKIESPSNVFLLLTIVTLLFAGASLRIFEITWLFFFLFIFHKIQLNSRIQFAIIIILIIFQLPYTYRKISDQFTSTNPNQIFVTTEWIKRNISPKERIFLPWADYPYFTYKNPEYVYLFGLNPLYAWAKNPDLYITQKNFFNGSANGFQMIPQVLGYKVVVFNKQYYSYAATLFGELNSNYSLGFRNEQYDVYIFNEEIKNTKKETNIKTK